MVFRLKSGATIKVSAKLTPAQALIRAEEKYLVACGWEKVKAPFDSKSFRWTPPKQCGYVYPGDHVFRECAIDVQKAADNFPQY
jgi:hypothetical protein